MNWHSKLAAYDLELIRSNNWFLALCEARDPRVSRTEHKVAGTLELLTDDSPDGTVPLSIYDLAAMVEATPKTVSACLHRLVKRGAINVVSPARGKQPATYAIDYDWANKPAAEWELERERRWQVQEEMAA
jgi:hypothetical protein